MDVQHLTVRHLDKVQLIYKEFLTSYRIQFDPSNAFFLFQTLTTMHKLIKTRENILSVELRSLYII